MEVGYTKIQEFTQKPTGKTIAVKIFFVKKNTK